MEFSSAHFLVGKELCERLHGHNYRVRIVIDGKPGEDGMIIDFLILKEVADRLCSEYDHKLLLPLRNPSLKITDENDLLKVKTAEGKIYVLPKEDVLGLDIKNTTCEELARDYCRKLVERLSEKTATAGLKSVSTTVEEADGQGATETIFLSD